MLTSITIKNLLPLVFRGMEDSSAIRDSQVWMVPELTFARGCRLCIQAESGQGKSSLLSFIYGNRTDYSGTILFDGNDIRNLTIEGWSGIRTSAISLLPQEMRLFPELTVMQNIGIKNSRTRHKTDRQIELLLERLGVASKRDTVVRRLSIGQQQRVAIIRALCQPFDFIFLDEPVSHLDRANNLTVASIIEEEASALGAGIITTSVGNNLLLDNAKYINL